MSDNLLSHTQQNNHHHRKQPSGSYEVFVCVLFCVLVWFVFWFVCFVSVWFLLFFRHSDDPIGLYTWSSTSTAFFGSSFHQDGWISNCITKCATCNSVLIDLAKTKRRWTKKKCDNEPGIRQVQVRAVKVRLISGPSLRATSAEPEKKKLWKSVSWLLCRFAMTHGTTPCEFSQSPARERLLLLVNRFFALERPKVKTRLWCLMLTKSEIRIQCGSPIWDSASTSTP